MSNAKRWSMLHNARKAAWCLFCDDGETTPGRVFNVDGLPACDSCGEDAMKMGAFIHARVRQPTEERMMEFEARE